MFKKNQKEVELSEGQLQIFESIVYRINKRVEFLTCTQYGKSWTTALACIIVSCIQGEVISIVAPTNEKAKQIMRYYIQHLGDSPLFYLQLEKETRLERLRQEESKERIILRNGGGIFVISVQSRNAKASIEAAMGAGAKIVIMDEACLISDDSEATAFRMIAGQGADAFYCKIGNPFYRAEPNSHFYQSYNDPAYKKIVIDWQQALKEGRYTEEFIKEALKKRLADVLYWCKFPEEGELDKLGYRRLIGDKYLQDLFVSTGVHKGTLRLGVDVGEGNDENVIALRSDTYAEIIHTSLTTDTMVMVTEVRKAIEAYNIEPENVFIDAIGIGSGVVNRLIELDFNVTGVKWSEKARENNEYKNLKAENFGDLELSIKSGLKVKEDNTLRKELEVIRYKADTDQRIKIKSKEELRKEGIDSPNRADALALSCNKTVEQLAPTILVR